MNRRCTEVLWLSGPSLLSSIYLATSGARIGATFDEPLYVRAGLEGWRSFSHGELLNEGVMPLPIDVQTLPVRLAELWRGRPFDLEAELAIVLAGARLGNLVFWWLLLLSGWCLGRQLGGRWGGRLTVLWLAVEPNLLAHAALATTDIAVTALLLLLCWAALISRDWSRRRRTILLALVYGLALAAKASALLYGPVLLLSLQLADAWQSGALRVWRRSSWRQRPRLLWSALGPLPGDLAVIVPGALGFVLLYGGTDGHIENSFLEWAQSLPSSLLADSMRWFAEHLRLFPNAGEAIVKQIAHNIRGHGTFLLGHVWPRAFWLYFPVALTIKLTLPYLVAAAALYATPSQRRNPALWAVTALLLISLTSRVQIGVRLVLPLVALLAVAAAVAAARTLEITDRRRPWAIATLTGATLAIAWSSWAAWPNALTTTNALWGGRSEGYLRLSDSNYDWGQGLPELRRWAEQHNVEELGVWYFGTDPSISAPPFRQLALNESTALESHLDPLPVRLVAVSTTLLYGSYPVGDPWVDYFRSQQPIDRTSTFLLYELDGRDLDGGGLDEPADLQEPGSRSLENREPGTVDPDS